MTHLMGQENNKEDIITVEPERFKGLINSFDGVTATKLMNRYKLPEYKANILMPTMILFNEIITAIEPKSLIFSSFSFSQGISWFYGVETENNPFMYQLREQNAQLARAVAARYHTDRIHDAVSYLAPYSVKHYDIKVYQNGGAIYVVLQPFFVL